MRLRIFLIGAALAVAATLLPAASANAATTGRANVRSSIGLNIRSGPSQGFKILSHLNNGAKVTVACEVTGQQIAGTQRTTARWNKLTGGGYVSDAYLAWISSRAAVPNCADGSTPTARVLVGTLLNVRAAPSLKAKIVGRLSPGTKLAVQCRAWGQTVNGDAIWYRIGKGRFVAERYVRWTPSKPSLLYCGQAKPDKPASTNAKFIAGIVKAAQASKRKYRVPASVTMAQAILESNWGRSALSRNEHNYFGMKCFGSPGPIAIGCATYSTHECSGTHCFGIRDSFRVYRNETDSFADHGRQLSTLARYKTAMKYVSNPNRFAIELQRAGYATSPTYAKKLIALMKKYNLYRYDTIRRA